MLSARWDNGRKGDKVKEREIIGRNWAPSLSLTVQTHTSIVLLFQVGIVWDWEPYPFRGNPFELPPIKGQVNLGSTTKLSDTYI